MRGVLQSIAVPSAIHARKFPPSVAPAVSTIPTRVMTRDFLILAKPSIFYDA